MAKLVSALFLLSFRGLVAGDVSLFNHAHCGGPNVVEIRVRTKSVQNEIVSTPAKYVIVCTPIVCARCFSLRILRWYICTLQPLLALYSYALRNKHIRRMCSSYAFSFWRGHIRWSQFNKWPSLLRHWKSPKSKLPAANFQEKQGPWIPFLLKTEVSKMCQVNDIFKREASHSEQMCRTLKYRYNVSRRMRGLETRLIFQTNDLFFLVLVTIASFTQRTNQELKRRSGDYSISTSILSQLSG